MEAIINEIVSSSSSSSSSSSESGDDISFLSSSEHEEFVNLQQNLFARAEHHRVKGFVEIVVRSYSEDEVSTLKYFIKVMT